MFKVNGSCQKISKGLENVVFFCLFPGPLPYQFTGISRLWTWTLDSETVDSGLNFSPKDRAKIALILNNGNCDRVHFSALH